MIDLIKSLAEAIEGATWGSGWNDHRSYVELDYEAATVLFALLGGDYIKLDVPPDKIAQFQRLWKDEIAKGGPVSIAVFHNLDRAFELSRKFVLGNAYHAKRGIYLLDQDCNAVLDHLREEVQELTDAQDDIDEMGDILALCANYSARKGWTPAMLAEAMERKMRLRLTLEKEKTA